MTIALIASIWTIMVIVQRLKGALNGFVGIIGHRQIVQKSTDMGGQYEEV